MSPKHEARNAIILPSPKLELAATQEPGPWQSQGLRTGLQSLCHSLSLKTQGTGDAESPYAAIAYITSLLCLWNLNTVPFDGTNLGLNGLSFLVGLILMPNSHFGCRFWLVCYRGQGLIEFVQQSAYFCRVHVSCTRSTSKNHQATSKHSNPEVE